MSERAFASAEQVALFDAPQTAERVPRVRRPSPPARPAVPAPAGVLVDLAEFRQRHARRLQARRLLAGGSQDLSPVADALVAFVEGLTSELDRSS